MRRYLVFITASLGLLMYAIDSTVVAVAFPRLVEDLGTNLLWAGWTISIYYIGVTTAMPLAGNLSDSFGRKKVFVISLVVFTISSLFCGLAPNIYTLILWRFLQGVGGASFLPTASGIATDLFPESRERVIGLLSSVFNAGSIIGPNLGGWIVSRYSWRYVFYINLPIGAGLIALIMLLLKGSTSQVRPHIDLKGAFYFSAAVLFLMFGVNLIGESFALHSLVTAGILLFLSLSLALLFLRQEKNESRPILDPVLLKSRPFLAANIVNMVMGAGFFGLFASVPLYATSVHRLSTLMSGMILTPRSLGVIFASIVTSFLLKRWGYRRPLIVGLGIVSCATILLAPVLPVIAIMQTKLDIGEILAFLILFCGVGAGMANPAANNACIELMPEKVATITGLRGMFRTVGGALGISVITFILHVSSTPSNGFSVIFILFGLALASVIPLVFLMPSGRRSWA
jgi:EmrB/QacA subfamily drug resistance transporter